MVDYNAPLYEHPQETWDAKKCARLARRRPTDAHGTPYPRGSLLNRELGHPYEGTVVRYNGGTVIDGVWWQGERWPLPKLAPGYAIINVCNWGYRIVKEEAASG